MRRRGPLAAEPPDNACQVIGRIGHDRVESVGVEAGDDIEAVAPVQGDRRRSCQRLAERVEAEGVDRRPYEPGRDLGIDRVAVTAQSHHSGGRPISQRECAGFNWTPARTVRVPAENPVRSSTIGR